MDTKLFVVVSILLLLTAYIVPYTIMRNAADLGLFLFWLVLTITEIIVALLYLSKRG
ncbi:MAG: hypothetical protein ABWW65_06115 [Thermoprotei archaeon]